MASDAIPIPIPRGSHENHENINQGNLSPGRDLNRGPPKYEGDCYLLGSRHALCEPYCVSMSDLILWRTQIDSNK
jgi:hypothetical protein